MLTETCRALWSRLLTQRGPTKERTPSPGPWVGAVATTRGMATFLPTASTMARLANLTGLSPNDPGCQAAGLNWQSTCYFKPNCALETSSPFWNVAFMLAPKPPSPSHEYITVL